MSEYVHELRQRPERRTEFVADRLCPERQDHEHQKDGDDREIAVEQELPRRFTSDCNELPDAGSPVERGVEGSG
jgi:hypothetical protein